jgi:hypothetical protein
MSLFNLNSTEGSVLSEDEKSKLKQIANNQTMPISEQMINSIEKSLDTAGNFLDQRNSWQDKFVSIFDTIRKPLLMFGIDLKPSDIL